MSVSRKRKGRSEFARDAQALAIYRPLPSYKRRKMGPRAFVPGRDRVGGFYGRYAGRGGELKFHDVDLDDAVVAATGTVTATVNIIAQGTTESERIGRKCTLKSILWKYQVNIPEVDGAGDPAAGDATRIIMFMDKQANGATAAVTDVLESADFQSFRNLANSGRFQILLDKLVTLNYATAASLAGGTIDQSNVQRNGSFYKKCNIPIEFSGVTGAIGEIRSNNIGVLLISDAGLSGFASKIRLRFSDQ